MYCSHKFIYFFLNTKYTYAISSLRKKNTEKKCIENLKCFSINKNNYKIHKIIVKIF